MWDPPGPGLKPVSPASAGRLSTTVPPGKPLTDRSYLKGDNGKYCDGYAIKSPLMLLGQNLYLWVLQPTSLNYTPLHEFVL